MRRPILVLLICLGVEGFVAAAPVSAQSELGGCAKWVVLSPQFERITENHIKLVGSTDDAVVVTCDEIEFSADEMELFRDQDRLLARGHVVFVSNGNRIYAERLDFNTQTRLGTFFVATGTATLGEKVERSFFGTQEPYATFWGEELHKVGPKKYRIVRGGFTTCVQPTPRWDVASSAVTLELDDYAILKNSVLRVKGVPLMYLPVFYYPIQEDDRATGFLLPTWGNSTYRGFTLSNQFFWAISRSQDATFVHDWFARTGQGYGGEYRYVGQNASNGTARVYLINEHAATFTNGGRDVETPARRSYELRGAIAQGLPANTRLAVNLDYFSDITVQQLYNQNLYEASRRSRSWGASTTSSWSGFTLLSQFNRGEIFYNENDSVVDGARPRLSFSRGATRIGAAPIYVSGNVDYANYQRETHSSGVLVRDASIQRWDTGGNVRVPYPAFSFLTVNSSLGWRGTRYGKSVNPATGEVIPVGVLRSYFEMRTEVTGPRLTRIWTRPAGRYAARIKHLIEPSIEFRRLTAIDNIDQIVKYDSSDYLIGGSLQTRYGVVSRVLVKGSGESAVSRELLNVSVYQTHYRDPRSSQFDPSYSTSFLGRPPSAFSPVSISASVTPAAGSSATLRIEYDPIISALQSISTSGTVRRRGVDVNATFSQRRLATGNNIFRSDNFLSAGTSVRNARNSLGGIYGFDYDFGRSTLIQQRMLGYYNAQCCGIAVEYQVYNYPSTSFFVIPQDRRFNLSFTLAGIGTFSNFLGALTGQPTNR